MAWYRPRLMTEHAMQSASIAQSLTKGIQPCSALPRNSPKAQARAPSALQGERAKGRRGRSSLFLLFRRRYPKREDFRHGTGIRPDLALIYQDYQVGSMGFVGKPRHAHSGICASPSNSRSDWRRAASAKRILRNEPRRKRGATRTRWRTACSASSA